MRSVKGVLSPRREPVLAALADGPRDTFEIAAATGIAKPGSILHTLMVERKVRRVGTRDTGRRPVVVWERVAQGSADCSLARRTCVRER